MQIRAKLTLRFIGIAAGILALLLAFVYQEFKRQTESVFFEGLESKTALATETTLQNESRLQPLPPVSSELDFGVLPYTENITIFDDAYQLVFSQRSDVEPVSAKTLQEVQELGERRFRHRNLHGLGRVGKAPSGRQYVVVAEGFCDPSDLNQLRNILIVSFLIGIGAVAAGGWYFAGQALSPVSRIVGAVDAIHPTDLSRRLETGDNQDELARLSETFNRLLDRVELAFRMQKQFLSNVSHELKNPLTAIRTQLDVTLQRERTTQEYRKALASVLDDITALSEVEEKLLQLARVHSEQTTIPINPLRLDELVWNVREIALKNHPEGKINVDFGEMPEDENLLWVNGNEPLLRTALVNLIENGIKYSPDRRVTIRIAFDEHGAHLLDVCDNGPGIPEAEIPLIFEPFYRSPRHRQVKGTGIGLSLTNSILQLHRIELRVTCPPTGGTIFGLRFGPHSEAKKL